MAKADTDADAVGGVAPVQPGRRPTSAARHVVGAGSTSPFGRAGVAGSVGSLCILFGVLQPGSPFVAHGDGSWFVTSAALASSEPEGARQFLGIMLTYLGIALMLGAWLDLLQATRAGRHLSVRRLGVLLAAWAAPVVVAPPLFSRDVYSYAAQGDMVTKGIDPYLHGPSVLGDGPFLHLVDPLWRNATSPYGPAWERLSGWIVTLSGHGVLATVLGFRLVAVAGVALVAWAVPVVARSIGRDPSTAFVLAVLNPLVVLVLVGGSHNDALMLGLLAAGVALAWRRHQVTGLVLCALAAEVKAPALVAAAFVGWAWLGADAPVRARLVRTVLALSFAVGVMAVVGVLSGLGWRWVGDVLGAGTVRSWLDPVTALGLGLAQVARASGAHVGSSGFVRATRDAGLVVAAVVSFRLLTRSDRDTSIGALGWSLLAFVLLGPIIWPWYETWGFVFLALVAEGWVLVLLVALSAVACFADMPSPHLLVDGPAALVVVSWAVLVGLVALYVATRRHDRGALDVKGLGAGGRPQGR